VAGVALGDIHLHFTWHLWHLWHWAGSGGALGPRLAPRRCLPGVALGDIDLHFAWQAWHLATSTSTLRGRRGTYGTGLALVARLGPVWRRGRVCVAGVAHDDIDVHSAWQAWHLATSTCILRGRHGTWRQAHLGPVWRRGRPRRQAWHWATSTFTLRGRRGTWRQAHLGPVWCRGRGTWRHRPSLCVAWRHRLAFCVAGVALGDIDRHFAWQVWHLATSTCTLRGRCGTYGTALPSVASVALGDIHLHFATLTFVLRGTW